MHSKQQQAAQTAAAAASATNTQPLEKRAEAGAGTNAGATPKTSTNNPSQTANSTNTGSKFRSSRNPLVVGKGQNINAVNGFAAAKPFKAAYCIDNVVMTCGVDDLVSFVSSLGVRVVTCYAVDARLTACQRKRKTLNRIIAHFASA